MSITEKASDRRGVYNIAAVACLLLVVGSVVLTLGFRASTDAGRQVESSPSLSTPQKPGPALRDAPTRGAQAQLRTTVAGSPPVAIAIPRIGVRATTFESLALARNGEIQVPQDADNPGWFTPGPAPGQLGPAVIAGHLDDESGPAVFYRLSELRSGDRVKVTPRRGPVKTFTIDRVATFDKDNFPTKAVYGPTPRSELRLITCEGRYDDQDGYVRNTVVFAHLV